MYEQISANKRKTVLLIFVFVLLLSLVGARGQLLPAAAASIGIVIVAVIVIVSSFVSYFNSDKVALRDRARGAGRSAAVRALPQPRRGPLHRERAAEAAALHRRRSRANAFSTGRNPKHAAVAVTTGLLEKMNRVELEGVLAHELSHIRNYDILVMTLAVTMVGIIALLSDFFLRIMFWSGGRGGRDNNDSNNPLGIVFAILGFVLLIFAPIIAYAHAVRGEPQARVPRRRVGRAAHAVPARAHLRAREAEGRPHRRSTPRRRPPRTSGSRSRSTRRRTRARRSWNHLFDTHPPLDDRIHALAGDVRR